MSDNHHGYPGADDLRRSIMIGHALCAEVANLIRDGRHEQANQTIREVKKIIAEAEVIVASVPLPHSTLNEVTELLSQLKLRLGTFEH